MTSFNAAKPKFSTENAEAETPDDEVKGFDDVVSRHVFQGKPALRNWKIKTGADGNSNEPADDAEEKQFSDDNILELPSGSASAPMKFAPSIWLQAVQAIAVFATVAWATYASIYILALPGGLKSILSSPLALGGVVASVLAPIALLWLCLATWQRRSDAHMYAEALRTELQRLLFPTQDQARVVNKDIQVLVQQAVEMSSSSRAAIKAIQRARQGLRAEIRDFAGVSQKTEFHIDRLAETLNKRAAELISLTKQIETNTTKIEQGTQEGVAAWTAAAETMEGKAAAIETIFESGADKITEASGKASEEIKGIETQLTEATDAFADKITELAGRFSGTSDAFEGHAERLQQVSSSVAEEVDKLNGAMEKTLEQQATFEEGAERIAAIADKISESVVSGVDKIDTTANSLFSRAENIEQKLTQKADNLEEAAVRLQTTTNSLGEVGDIAANKLGEALSLAISGSDTIMNSVRRAKEQLEKAAQETTAQAESLSARTDDKVDALLNATTEKISRISDVLKEFDERHLDIQSILENLDNRGTTVNDTVTSALGRIEDTIVQLQEGATQIESKMEAPVSKIEGTISRLTEQADDFDARLKARVDALESGSQKARDVVEGMNTSMKEYLSDLSTVTGEVSGQARMLTDRIQSQKEGLSTLVAQTETQIETLQGRLKRQEIDLTTAMKAAETQIQGLGDQIFERGELSFGKAKEIADSLRQLEEQIVSDLSRINERSVLTSTVMKDVAEAVSAAVEETMPRYEQALDHADQLESRYTRLHSTFETTSDVVVAGMKELSTQLEDNLDRFDLSSRSASSTLMNLVQDVGSSVMDIRNVAEEAREKIDEAQDGIKGRTDDLQLMADKVRLRIESLQRNLSDYTGDIAEAVVRSSTQLEAATNMFSETSGMLGDKTDAVTGKLQVASRQYIEEGHRLSMLSEQTMHKAARMVSAVQEESERLANSTKDSLQDLQKTGDSLAIRAREVDEYIKASVRNTQSYTDELRNQASIVADASADSVDKIAGAIGELTNQADEARTIGQKMSQHIEVSRQKLADESDRLATVAHKAVQTAEVAASAFTRQSNTLFKAVQDVAVHAEKIRDSQWKTQREAFLSSSKFVIESLYSLSLDVARHLEADLDPRILKAYQRGDVAAFARHLVEIAPSIPADRAQRKFIEDSEFRNYVQRFIRQFEELLEQAQGNDYGDLLASIFTSSDIGKLYRILCEIASRDARIQ